MSAALRALLSSPLADRYQLDVVATYRGAEPLRRLVVYCGALARLVGWRTRRRGRIVHIHATVRGSMYRKSVLALLAKALGLRVVLHVHSGPGDIAAFAAGVSSGSLALFQTALRSVDVALAVSRASAEAVEREYGVGGLRVVPNAAPRMAAPAPRAGAEMAALYLGGFANRAKGGDVLLAALALPEAPEMSVVMAGPGELPESGRQLSRRRPGFAWLGWLGEGERATALAAADTFVLSSRSEGLPMALLEAMASGLAIVATRVGGVPEVLEDERDALLVSPDDPLALALALARLGVDADLRTRLGRAARARAGELDAFSVADQLDAIYAELG